MSGWYAVTPVVGTRGLIAIVVALAVACACSATPKAVPPTPAPAEAGPPAVQYESKPASVDGFVFVNPALASENASPDGWRIGGVALTRDATAPAGFAPYGGSVELVDALTGSRIATVKPDDHGLAKVTNVHPGRYRVRVLTATPREFSLTLIGDATVRWGSYPVSRAKAFEMAKQQIATTLRTGTTLIASPQTPLPAGVVVSPALGDDNGQQAAPLDTTLGKPSWFFYVDPLTDQKFHHPVKYVFVDAETGQTSEKDADSWPALNRASYYRHSDDLERSADVLLLHIIVPEYEIMPIYTCYNVETRQGQGFTGLLAAETATSITLRMAQGLEQQVPRSEIASMTTSRLSLMPQELEKAMSKQDLADLLAFLKGYGDR